MQMSVCHRHPVIMLYLCPMPFRRKSSGGWLVSCSLTVHWLHRPGRLLEARVMKADIVSCLWGKGSWICTSAPPRCGAEGHSVSPEQRFGFWSVAPPSRLQSLSFIPKVPFHGFVHRFSIPLPEPVLHSDGRNSQPRPSVLHPTSEPVPHPESPISRPRPSVLYPASRACPSSR